MRQNSLRDALRTHTAPLHTELDRMVGGFETREQYLPYLRHTYRFRHMVEPAVLGAAFWPVRPIAAEAARDLADLGAPLPVCPVIAPLTDPSETLGALYVLEGSSVGARLLYRRAQALGLTETFGARHLAEQASQPQRWPEFLNLLNDGSAHLERDRIFAGAEQMFRVALSIYAETAHA